MPLLADEDDVSREEATAGLSSSGRSGRAQAELNPGPPESRKAPSHRVGLAAPSQHHPHRHSSLHRQSQEAVDKQQEPGAAAGQAGEEAPSSRPAEQQTADTAAATGSIPRSAASSAGQRQAGGSAQQDCTTPAAQQPAPSRSGQELAELPGQQQAASSSQLDRTASAAHRQAHSRLQQGSARSGRASQGGLSPTLSGWLPVRGRSGPVQDEMVSQAMAGAMSLTFSGGIGLDQVRILHAHILSQEQQSTSAALPDDLPEHCRATM